MEKMKFKKEIARMRRIEGQARGVRKMMEDERYCIDLLTQLSAIEAAVRAAKQKVLAIHAANCVEAVIDSGNAAEQREKFDELIMLFGKLGRS